MAKIQKNPSPTTKTELLSFIEAVNFWFKVIDRLHIRRSFCLIFFLIMLSFTGKMTLKLFQQIEISVRKDVTVT